MRGGIDSEDLRFWPWLVRDVDVWQYFSTGNGTLSSPVAVGATNTSRSAINQQDWGFQTVLGGIHSGDRRFRSRIVAVVDV